MQYGDACASVGSEPIGGSRGNRHGIWLSRTLDATRPRSLALDGNERSRGELPTQGAQVASTVDACAANRESHRRERALTAITSRLYSASTVPCNAEKATGGVNQSGTRTYRPENDSIPIPFFPFRASAVVRAVPHLYVIAMTGRSGTVHDKEGIEWRESNRYIIPALLRVRLDRKARPLCVA